MAALFVWHGAHQRTERQGQGSAETKKLLEESEALAKELPAGAQKRS